MPYIVLLSYNSVSDAPFLTFQSELSRYRQEWALLFRMKGSHMHSSAPSQLGYCIDPVCLRKLYSLPCSSLQVAMALLRCLHFSLDWVSSSVRGNNGLCGCCPEADPENLLCSPDLMSWNDAQRRLLSVLFKIFPWINFSEPGCLQNAILHVCGSSWSTPSVPETK